MPVWFEMMVVLLATYGLGLGIGWLIWGSGAAGTDGQKNTNGDKAEKEDT